jgi:hypothetical protein
MSVNKKEMVKEIANLIINRVDFSEIDYFNQPLERTEYGTYRIFRGYLTFDFINAKIKRAIYDVAQPIVDFDFSGEIEEILETHGYCDYIEKDEMRDFPKEFYIDLIEEILDDERVNEQIDYSVFEY